jgi:tRNA threonylcarbamoyladenosine biosynthesis protein TsaB
VLILAVESATTAASVALLRGEELVAELACDGPGAVSERLLPAIDALLRDAKVELAAVEAFAVSVGPGSFTGLRVGLATVVGLAFGGERPAAAVPTLRALAHPALEGSGPVAALLDARRGEVYAAVYDAGGALRVPDAVLTPEALAALLPERTRIVAGEGAGFAAELLASRLGARVRVLGAPFGAARAAHVGVLGARALARGEGVPAIELTPRYVRRAEAEVRRTGERFEDPPR